MEAGYGWREYRNRAGTSKKPRFCDKICYNGRTIPQSAGALAMFHMNGPPDRINAAPSKPRSMGRAAVTMAMAGLLLAALATSGTAQTLADPSPPAQRSPPRAVAKSRPRPHLKSCSTFGPGFVNVPGTDTCVRISGWSETEGTVRGH